MSTHCLVAGAEDMTHGSSNWLTVFFFLISDPFDHDHVGSQVHCVEILLSH